MLVQLLPAGANWTAPNPLAMPAVIEPDPWVVRSFTPMKRPFELSWMFTATWSPEFMNRSFEGSGVNLAAVASTGFAGACDFPLLVMNAKLSYSSPTRLVQVGFRVAPVFSLSARLQMFTATHHWVPVQLVKLCWSGTQPG